MIEVHTTRAVLIVCLSGEIDLASAPSLTAALSTATAGDWKAVAAECSTLRFIDVVGARPLAVARCEASSRQMGFFILDPSPFVGRVLDLFCLRDSIVPGKRVVADDINRSGQSQRAPLVIDLAASEVLGRIGRRYLDLPAAAEGFG